MTAATRPLQIRPDFRAGIRLLARLARVAEQACQTTGISLPQYRLLVSISGQPQRASELATAVGVSRPTLTALVDGLEQGGYLRRVPVANDRRGIQLVPIPDEEFATQGCNVLVTAPRQCILLKENQITAELLRESGCEVTIYAGGEISHNRAGGPTCLTRPLLRTRD